MGVPVKLGRNGVEAILDVKLSPEEEATFKRSAQAGKELVDRLGL